jgi:hypothetical protein
MSGGDGYDPCNDIPPGLVLTRPMQDALIAAYAANHYKPLSQAQIEAITGPALPFPQWLRRLPDSNPPPRLG